MKVTLDESAKDLMEIRDMPIGSIGVCPTDGKLFYRTGETAACLSCVGSSYSSGLVNVNKKVRILPRGTKIILEVE